MVAIPRSNCRRVKGVTHKHAIISVFVKQNHACLRSHCNFLLGHSSVVGKEDRLTASAAVGFRGEIQ